MGKVTMVLIDNLARGGTVALAAADALGNQATRNGPALAANLDRLVPYLNDSNFGIRAAISQVLGKIGTKEAITELMDSIAVERPGILHVSCSYACWSEEPLFYWLVSGIAEAKNELAAEALCTLAVRNKHDKHLRACAMEQLSYFIDDLEMSFSDQLVEAVAELASDSDTNVAEKATALLGSL